MIEDTIRQMKEKKLLQKNQVLLKKLIDSDKGVSIYNTEVQNIIDYLLGFYEQKEEMEAHIKIVKSSFEMIQIFLNNHLLTFIRGFYCSNTARYSSVNFSIWNGYLWSDNTVTEYNSIAIDSKRYTFDLKTASDVQWIDSHGKSHNSNELASYWFEKFINISKNSGRED